MSSRFDEIVWRGSCRPEEKDTKYEAPKKEEKLLPAGFRLEPQNTTFTMDCVWERNKPIHMRDGTVIMVDIFRPRNSAPKSVPALLAWSPYGKSACWMGGQCRNKQGTNHSLVDHTIGFDHVSMIDGRVGVREDQLSGYQKFEGPDPAEWIPRGYAVVNPDSRGSYDSEGEL